MMGVLFTLWLFGTEEKTDHHPPPEPDKHQCSVQTVTLSCSGEHSVYWIRHGSGEPHPGIIYTPPYTSDECESSSETDSSTQSCVYKLPKRNLSLSDAGTYYCAVAACGPETKSTGKARKAPGPDSIPGRVLRECTDQLADVFMDIINISLSTAVVPTCFKTTIIIPVPKKSTMSCLNDYHPIALTPINMKCFKRLVMRHIKGQLSSSLDPLQFAHRPTRSTDDAITTTLHLALTHLDNKDTYVRLLFLVFSSAFNTIIPQHLIGELGLPGLNTSHCNWVQDFLTDRPQSVRSTKFLGVHITENLPRSLNTSSIAKNAQQRLYFLRRLRRAHLPPPILTVFYRGTVESILRSCIIACFGNCNASDSKTLQKIVHQYQNGVTQRKIAKTFKLSSSTVHNIIKRFRESGTITVRKGQGRKTLLDARDLRALKRHCTSNRNTTVKEITEWAQEYFQKALSVNTIHRAIRRCQLKLYSAKRKPFLSKLHKLRRLHWATGLLKWSVAKWKTVLWSDESRFEVLYGTLGRHVIRTREDKDNPSCYQRSVQKPASLMPIREVHNFRMPRHVIHKVSSATDSATLRRSVLLMMHFCVSVKTSDTEELQVQTVKYGENVTVKCDHDFVKGSRQHYLAWYKQSFGKQPQFIARSSESKADIRCARAFAERFRVTADEGKFDLSIINTVDEDTGTYFCVKLKDFAAEFGSGTLLLFTDEKSQQSDVTEVDVKRGESVTLQCSVARLSCSGEHSVYWYRHGSGESHPGIIYTHGNTNSPCTRSSETDSSTQSCVYKLLKSNLSLSDAGTYYCAVAACGQILFGDGTKLSVKGRTVLHSFLSVMEFH
ncbi:hypothetical protein NFI96_033225 [Prochilodus magdalenae]|nr:hypothetical protein NFI96_033225 [Prochilodus magdalenae]